MPRSMCGILLAGALVSSGGCVSYHTTRGVTQSDLPDPKLVAQVMPGKTTTAWLLAELGEPTVITAADASPDGAIWQYHRVTASSTRMRVLPVLAFSVRDEHRTAYNFEVSNGRVTRHWVSTPEPR